MRPSDPSEAVRGLTSPHTLAWIGIVTVAYVAAGRMGLALDAVSGFAALVWPASGIALAALLLGGNVLWPAIAIGAFITNYWTGAPLATSVGIAFGNTSAALLGVTLLRRVPDFDPALERIRDVLALILLAAVTSTLVSATIGATALLVSGVMPATDYVETWRAWWVGDAIGDVAVAPLILVWSRWRPRGMSHARIAEAIGLGLVVITASFFIFGSLGPVASLLQGREYMLLPALIWASLRFGVTGAVTATVLTMLIAVIRTAAGHGPFIAPELHQSLLALQAFMGISAATFLLLGAAISERGRSAAELVSARETAETANRAKAGFLATVSHELRTPLNAITGYVDLLTLEIEGPLTDRQRALLARISHSQRHLLLLIEDVLGFAQVEAGRLSLDLQPVVVADVLASVEPIVGPEIAKKGLTLHIGDTDHGLVVRADFDKLRQILVNLVSNAIKFTDAPGLIEVNAKCADSGVRLSVSDTGIGIPEDQLERVFSPFFQIYQGPTRRYPGLGLGLSIVRDIAQAMDGDVEIESTVGKGTRVTVLLPQM